MVAHLPTDMLPPKRGGPPTQTPLLCVERTPEPQTGALTCLAPRDSSRGQEGTARGPAREALKLPGHFTANR